MQVALHRKKSRFATSLCVDVSYRGRREQRTPSRGGGVGVSYFNLAAFFLPVFYRMRIKVWLVLLSSLGHNDDHYVCCKARMDWSFYNNKHQRWCVDFVRMLVPR